jgi:hypothetical protein
MVEGFHYMTPYEMSFYDWMVEGFPDMIPYEMPFMIGWLKGSLI